MTYSRSIVITCGKGIAKILRKEIEDLGYNVVVENPLSIEIKGNMRDCMYLNLYLRTANKVLLLISKFQASHPDHLYRAVSKNTLGRPSAGQRLYLCHFSYTKSLYSGYPVWEPKSQRCHC